MEYLNTSCLGPALLPFVPVFFCEKLYFFPFRLIYWLQTLNDTCFMIALFTKFRREIFSVSFKLHNFGVMHWEIKIQSAQADMKERERERFGYPITMSKVYCSIPPFFKPQLITSNCFSAEFRNMRKTFRTWYLFPLFI